MRAAGSHTHLMAFVPPAREVAGVVGSFTTSFTRTFGESPTAYRARFPPAAAHGPCATPT